MTLVIAFRENDKNYIIADQYSTVHDQRTNTLEIFRKWNKIKKGKNFAMALTTPTISIADFTEHAIQDLTLEDTKKWVYDLLVWLNKRMLNEFIREPKMLSYKWIIITKESIWCFDSDMSITRRDFYAVWTQRHMAMYVLEMNQLWILWRVDHIYEYAHKHSETISKEYDTYSL